MIPANELRIGNWAYDNKLNGCIRFTSFHGLCNIENKPDDYDPIPLTPEVLEKCGFDWIIWDGNEHHKVLSYKNTPIHIYWDGSEWCFKYGFDSDLTFAACQYVHQLQNLIHVLTGEELPVTL